LLLGGDGIKRTALPAGLGLQGQALASGVDSPAPDRGRQDNELLPLPACRAMPTPTILFGAFDRHNFGDLLFPHVVAAMLGPGDVRIAGLAARDMRPVGGHLVQNIGELAGEFGKQPVRVIHAGGEVLTYSRWEAAVMLLTNAEAKATIRRFDGRSGTAMQWAEQVLGTHSLAPYAAGGARFAAAQVSYHAVGGVELGLLGASSPWLMACRASTWCRKTARHALASKLNLRRPGKPRMYHMA
jgi:hypothetical protein